jgi:hypothetical protein
VQNTSELAGVHAHFGGNLLYSPSDSLQGYSAVESNGGPATGGIGKPLYYAPIATAGPGLEISDALAPNVILLNGSAVANSAGPLTYLWEQIDGPKVTLLNATSPKAAFVVPRGLAGDSTLKFRFTVFDGDQRSENTTYIRLLADSTAANAATSTPPVSSETIIIAAVGGVIAAVGLVAAKGQALLKRAKRGGDAPDA